MSDIDWKDVAKMHEREIETLRCQLAGAVETLKRIAERDEYGKPALVSEGACQFAAHALDRLAEGAV
jgi:hypothetical protein